MHILQTFMQFLKTRETADFIKSMIICFGAPVADGIKSAILINLSRPGEDIRHKWRRARDDMPAPLSLEFAEMASTERSVLLLVYRPELIARAIKPETTRKFLSRFGYAGFDSPSNCIGRLRERFSDKLPAKVPHEVGVFLDYPLEDVIGFIENEGKNCKCAGYWKVYGDMNSAIGKFNAYKISETKSARSLLAKEGIRVLTD